MVKKITEVTSLTAISPIDGRYHPQVSSLSEYFSEYALFKTRLEIEIKWLVFLSKIGIVRNIKAKERKLLEDIYKIFSKKEARAVKKLEEKTHHDVKAIEYFLRENFRNNPLNYLSAWIHFGLTSNDINDNAYRLMVRRALLKVIIPEVESLITQLSIIIKKYSNLPILGRTHGQPAIPTTFGKEIAVFASRIQKEVAYLQKIKLYGKLGGAIGNWNSLYFTFPQKNWPALSGKFLEGLGLKHSEITTQIAPPEDLIQIFHSFIRVNSILIDLNQDVWRYISDDWIKQKRKEKHVGSSTMPQKINPIEFENSEGNLVLANGIFEIMSRKLPISRLQRDLSDSTISRNFGVAFAHSLLAYKSCLRGLLSIDPNEKKMKEDLSYDWSILTEALQTLLKNEENQDAYEKVASLARGKRLTEKDWISLVESFDISKKSKVELKKLSPETYTGIIQKW